jgi:hypothetical protein
VVKPMLERAGFTVDLRNMDWATLVSGGGGRSGGRLRYADRVLPDPVFVVPLRFTWPGWWSAGGHGDDGAAAAAYQPCDPVRSGTVCRTWYEDAGR